jgi:hypothetical protein
VEILKALVGRAKVAPLIIQDIPMDGSVWSKEEQGNQSAEFKDLGG